VSGRDPFWERVHAALDAHADPLDDAEVQRLLAQQPERLAELAALRSGLAQVTRAGRRRVQLRALAAALVLLVAVPLGLRATRQATGTRGAVAPITAAGAGMGPPAVPAIHAAPLQVLAFRAEVTVEGPRGRRTRVFEDLDGRGSTVRTEAGPGAEDVPLFVATVSVALP
jgi:hypothetical protein